MTKRNQHELRRLERQLMEENRAVVELPPGMPRELQLEILRGVFREILPSEDFQKQRQLHGDKIVHIHLCTGICPVCTFRPFCSPERVAAQKAQLGEAMAELYGIPAGGTRGC